MTLTVGDKITELKIILWFKTINTGTYSYKYSDIPHYNYLIILCLKIWYHSEHYVIIKHNINDSRRDSFFTGNNIMFHWILEFDFINYYRLIKIIFNFFIEHILEQK